MSPYDLPTTLTVGDVEYEIRSDYRAVLDVMEVLGDPELDDGERAMVAVQIVYVDADSIPARHLQEAVDRLLWFVRGGEEQPKGGRRRRVMDWRQDFKLIVAPVNRVLGFECRTVEYLHWWSFLTAYYEIGDCLFAQVVAIRKKRQEGKKLDKSEQQFYQDNRSLVDLRRKQTDAETALLGEWTGRQ